MGEKDPLYGLGDPLPPLHDLFLDKKKTKDPLADLFTDPNSVGKKKDTTDSDDKSGTDVDCTEDDDEDWLTSAPPLDYLERVKVNISLCTNHLV